MAGTDALKNVIFLLFALIFLVMVIITARTLTILNREEELEECTPMDTDFIKADKELLGRFSKAITFQTISRNPGDYNRQELLDLQAYIKKTYKTLHSSPLVKHEVVANYSLLYFIQGSDQSLKPYLLMGHLDVVPVPDPSVWEEPPFEGKIRDGFVYGRGTIDNKQTVFGILEAIEFHLKRGFKPKRSIFIAFGHDEEVRGDEGAKAVGKLLQEREVKLEFLLDEGLAIIDGILRGLQIPVGLIGTSEKGYVTIELKVKVKGGHSSMPTKDSAIGILARAVSRLEDNPHPSMLGYGPERGMFEHLAPAMQLPYRILMSNLWIFTPLISRVLGAKPESNAMIRTTTAVTEFHAGIKENVIAPEAKATVNHRIHPAQTVQEVIDYDRRIINDERVEISVRSSMEPHPKSPYCDECFGYQTIKTSMRQVWKHKGVVVAPGLMVGNTDTRHYLNLTSNVYRFSPTYMYPGDPPRFHGVNERIGVKNYEEAVNFFYHVIANADRAKLRPMHKHGGEL